MYEKHFGLKSRPFRSRLEASGIFVGPAQVKVMANLKKALAASDAVVTLTGPVGVGKSTVVNRALESACPKRIVAHVGRMQLASDEVLELLLTEFNVSRQPTGTIQRFAAFKRLLHDWALADTRAFIVVEDAERIGSDALIELEALTAADSGDGTGASIVMMGQASLSDLVSAPALARLRQRIRLRQGLGPLNAAELQGYLKHCIRSAGGEFDEIFDPGALEMIYRCSDGIPRVVNNLCESVLAAAAEANAAIVMPQLVQYVAQEQFGIQPAPAQRPKPEPVATSETKPEPKIQSRDEAQFVSKLEARPETTPVAKSTVKAKPEPANETAAKPEPAPASLPPTTSSPAIKPDVAAATVPDDNRTTGISANGFEPLPVSEFTADPEPGPVPAIPQGVEVKVASAPKPQSVPAAAPPGGEEDEIPELIQDTQPALAALSDDSDLPDLTDLDRVPTAAAKAKPATKGDGSMRLPTMDDIPTLSSELEVSKPKKPAQPSAGKSTTRPPVVTPRPAPQQVVAKSDDDEIPKLEATITEIPAWDRDPTLAELKPDFAALEEALADAPSAPAKTAPNVASPAAAPPQKAKQTSKPFDLPEITLEKELKVKEVEAQELLLRKAKPDTHKDDIDASAIRHRGFDLDKLAAELGRARSLEDVDDKLAETLFGEEMAGAAAEVAAMVAADEAARKKKVDAASEVKPELSLEEPVPPEEPDKQAIAPAAEKTSQAPIPAPNNAARNSGMPATPVLPGPPIEITMQSDPDPLPVTDEASPETIEEQFGTSMTATLKALSAAQVQQMDESANDDDDKAPRRLFGLFRGSS